jgi:hypothetical protein
MPVEPRRPSARLCWPRRPNCCFVAIAGKGPPRAVNRRSRSPVRSERRRSKRTSSTPVARIGAVGEFDRAVESAARARAIARRLGLAEEIGRSYIKAAMRSTTPGRVEESIALARDHGDPGLWGEAEALWDACGDRYLAAYAGWRCAEALLELAADR